MLLLATLLDCPIFYTLLDGNCIKNNRPAIVFSFETAELIINDTYSTNISLVSSPVPPLYGTNRGKYFNGLSNYFQLNVDYNYLWKNLTLYLWAFPENTIRASLIGGQNFEILVDGLGLAYNYTKIGFSQDVQLANKWNLIKIHMMFSGSGFTISSAILENSVYNYNYTVYLDSSN